MKSNVLKSGVFKRNQGGFTLIELVMTIILIGIMSVGLYEVVIWGISDYIGSENYLHSNNSMTYASSVIRRNLENAATPTPTPTALIKPRNGRKKTYCKVENKINPATIGNPPIVIANLAGQTTTCGGTGRPVCNEAAFYQNVTVASQQLVVFCVNNNILYEEVTDETRTTTSYPVADNISGINF